jgi:hypothetical protein
MYDARRKNLIPVNRIEGKRALTITGLLGCLRGRHERSEQHVKKRGDDDYVSVCRHCRTPMRRVAKRQWVADPAARVE